MESKEAISLVEDLFEFRNLLETPTEIADEFAILGWSISDLRDDTHLLFEAGIARNIRRACATIDLPIFAQESLTLARHMLVGQRRYRNGVPLTENERDIPMRLRRIYLQECCRKMGQPFTEEVAKDCERLVHFGEHGLTIGHKIGEVSGCFQVLLFVGFSISFFMALTAIFLPERG